MFVRDEAMFARRKPNLDRREPDYDPTTTVLLKAKMAGAETLTHLIFSPTIGVHPTF